MAKEYVVDGATLKCSMGTGTSNLMVSASRNVLLRGKREANIGDCKPFTNIPSFDACNITSPPKACAPACAMWAGGKGDVLIQGSPALLNDSFVLCASGGGIITISDSGQ